MESKATRISEKFNELRKKNETAFIPFITAGDPSLNHTRELLYSLKEAGADVIELGIPYSDPLADGPVIQRAALRSLAQGTTLTQVISFVGEMRDEGFDLPLILFTYFNPVLQRGLRSFFEAASKAGADGVIIPDLPVEESQEAQGFANEFGMDLIPLVAPTSQERIEKICKNATGFIYCVATLGVTGARDAVSASLPQFVESVRNYAKVPVAVGFGVSTREQASEIAQYADGVIVGSALVKRVENLALALESGNAESQALAIEDFGQFAASLKVRSGV